MPCIPIKGGFVRVNIAPMYKYKGFLFENHPWYGPIKLNADGTTSARCGTRFRDAVKEWANLPIEEREKYRVEI